MGRGEDSRVSGGTTERKKVNLTEQEANRERSRRPWRGWTLGGGGGGEHCSKEAHCSVAVTAKPPNCHREAG